MQSRPADDARQRLPRLVNNNRYKQKSPGFGVGFSVFSSL